MAAFHEALSTGKQQAAAADSHTQQHVVLSPLPVRMLIAREGSSERRYRLRLAHIPLHFSRGGERVCGVACYMPMPRGRAAKGGVDECAGSKRKARQALHGLVNEGDLDAWLREVGEDDIEDDLLLEELQASAPWL